ncbi:unnamed protein product [Symbiodinium natans]|uniref:Transmembrane protein n=1 Tax=Symbiodinium natans TaxID=878477 RepID=A0A812MCF0_9DINO|nr:unnamed protein product [Symbiodinium natans]
MSRKVQYDPSTWQAQERMSLHEMSHAVESFQVFLSHTWRTPGKWKFLALSFQCGWQYALGGWFMSLVLCWGLCAVDVLPMPLEYDATILDFEDLCPLGFWIITGGLLATTFGLLSVPLWPDRCCRPDLSFIDVTSINQVDTVLMERGVFGIAGFLSLSSELRILWSSPYLSRLWCVFELAAYKKVRPTGKISFRPLFIEKVMFWMLSCSYLYGFLILFARGLLGATVILLAAVFAIYFVTWTIGIYMLRMNFREKHHLLHQLEHFDLDHAHCSRPFDRQFIHDAIVEWYGSTDAFVDFVRGDLRLDLEKVLSAVRLPNQYQILLLTPALSLSAELLLANWKGGAPAEVLLSFVVGSTLGMNIFYTLACNLLMLYLCDVLAPRRFGCMDHLQTLFIIVLVVGLWGAGSVLCARMFQESLARAFIFLIGSIAFAAFMWWLEGRSAMAVLSRFHRRWR